MRTGEKIRYLRKIKGLTMHELGKILGITGETVRKYENEAISLAPRLYDVARALDVSPISLLDDADTDQDLQEQLMKISDEIHQCVMSAMMNIQNKLKDMQDLILTASIDKCGKSKRIEDS